MELAAAIAMVGAATMKGDHSVIPVDQSSATKNRVIAGDGFLKVPAITETIDGRVSRLILNSNGTLEQIFAMMEKYSTVFTKEDFKDLKIYYPLYLTIAQRWEIDWKLLWVVHFYETNCSRNPLTEKVRYVRDYDKAGNTIISNSLFGAMQRDIRIYPEALVGELFAGLEYLERIPTRYKSDAREINFAAWKLSRDLKRARGDTVSQLQSYSHVDFASARWRLLNFLNVIFRGIS